MFVSPMNFFAPKGVEIDNQWIGFFASYLGGILGGIISGSLTLAGVYLTIKHQKKLLDEAKYKKIKYVMNHLKSRFINWNRLFIEKEKLELSDGKKIKKIQDNATSFLKTIDEHRKQIMEADLEFIEIIDSTSKKLKWIVYYFDEPSHRQNTNKKILEDFGVINNSIQICEFKNLEQYLRKIYSSPK